MSQAVIDFCEGLKTTLLGLEQQMGAVKRGMEGGASQMEAEAKKRIEEAAEQLETFRAHASMMAEAIRADLPEHSAAMTAKAKEVGGEAQLAMRQAIMLLAEAAAKGAEGAASALKEGAGRAHAFAEEMRRQPEASATAQADKPDAS